MLWYFVDALVTLPLLFAIIATLVEFRFSKKRSILIIALTICVIVLMESWKYLHGAGLADIYANTWLTTCIPSFLCLLYLAKYRDGSFFFAFFTQCVLATITTFLAYIFAYLLPWQSGFFPFLFHTAMLVGILFVCRRFLGRKFMEASRYQGKRWLLYCALPFMCIVIWVMYTGLSTHSLDTANKINLPYAGYIYPQEIPALVVLLVIVFYMVSLILIMITITHQADRDRREKTALYFQSKALQERLFSLEDKDESLRILRHDMRHHLSTLSGLLHNLELIRAQEYISQLDHNLTQTKQESFCANPVINAVISYYTEIAQKEEIEFSVRVRISGGLPVDDMDIGAVLANALENAYNACKRQAGGAKRFIQLKFIQHKKQFVLDISNSFDGAVAFDATGHPVPQKKDHGTGSQSIFAFARKYNATIDYSAKKGVFSLRIMFTDTE